MNIEEFVETIKRDAQSDIDRIISSAKQEAKTILLNKKKELEKNYRRKIAALKSEMESMKRKLVSKVELKAKTEFSKWLSETINNFLSEAWREIISFKKLNREKYADFIVSRVVNAARLMDTENIILVLSKEDEDLTNSILGKLKSEKVNVKGVEFEELEGGAKIFTPDRRVMVDETLKTRFERLKNDLSRIILKEIAEEKDER